MTAAHCGPRADPRPWNQGRTAIDQQQPVTTPAPAPLPNNSSLQLRSPNMHKPPANTAAIYVKEPARPHSAGADASTQLAEALQYCADCGMSAAAHYQDQTGSREQFQKMMSDATSDERPYSHIVVWKLMYFAWSSRNPFSHATSCRPTASGCYRSRNDNPESRPAATTDLR